MNKSFFKFLRWSYLYHMWPKPNGAVSACLQKYLKKGDIVFDIGGNCGNTALEISGIIGPTGNVFSFEPNPSQFENCQIIEELNLFQNIKFFNIGVGAENRHLPFFIDTREGNQASTFDILNLEAEKLLAGHDFFYETSAEVKRLDDIELPPPNLIKLDIEGFELEALVGGLEIIRKNRPILIFEFFLNDNDPDIAKRREELLLYLKDLNYDAEIFQIFSGGILSDNAEGRYSLSGSHFNQYTGCDIVAIPRN